MIEVLLNTITLQNKIKKKLLKIKDEGVKNKFQKLE